jgi:transposase
MSTSRRRFSREFKVEAVRMVTEGGHSLAQVARDLEVRPDMLRRWRRQLEEDPEQAFPGVGQRKGRDEEVWRLRRDLERVTQERDILKRSARHRLGPPAAHQCTSCGDIRPVAAGPDGRRWCRRRGPNAPPRGPRRPRSTR